MVKNNRSVQVLKDEEASLAGPESDARGSKMHKDFA